MVERHCCQLLSSTKLGHSAYAGMSGEQHVAYDHQTAVGAPVGQDPSQVHYHHETVTGHPESVTGHPEAYGHKVEDNERISQAHDRHQ